MMILPWLDHCAILLKHLVLILSKSYLHIVVISSISNNTSNSKSGKSSANSNSSIALMRVSLCGRDLSNNDLTRIDSESFRDLSSLRSL